MTALGFAFGFLGGAAVMFALHALGRRFDRQKRIARRLHQSSHTIRNAVANPPTNITTRVMANLPMGSEMTADRTANMENAAGRPLPAGVFRKLPAGEVETRVNLWS